MIVRRLNELLEAERAGVDTLAALMAETREPGLRGAFERVRDDEAWSCAGLVGAIRRLGGEASKKRGDFAARVMALPSLPERLKLLNRGQAWVVKRVDALLEERLDEETREFLGRMHAVHQRNIDSCEDLISELAPRGNEPRKRSQQKDSRSESPRELDVRALPPPRRHSEIFSTFDALQPGEAFVLVNDHAPKPLLHRFQAERAGGFDWNVLEAAPERFRVEIRRRSQDGPRGVSEYLQTDHRRLDSILEEVGRRLEAGASDGAGARFAEFACGLNRHIDAEEQVLFPFFEQSTGMTSGPTMVMRSEHLEIRGLLDRARSAIEGISASAAREALQTLTALLEEHNAKEEGILYPMTDRVAGGEQERDELVRRMQAL